MQIQFNTGRQYTRHGQRIIAELCDDCTILFHDLDRMIAGEIEPRDPELVKAFWQSKDSAARAVMRAYDAGRYERTKRADHAAFYEGGSIAAALWNEAGA